MSDTSSNDVVEVAAGVMVDAYGRILVARRADNAHQGGLWEFPGGKKQPGEGGIEALRRELDEELGIELVGARPLVRVRHDYDDRSVLLDCWRVESWRGEPVGMQRQPLKWVAPEALAELQMPAADRPIVNAARLPSLCLVTPEPGQEHEAWLADLGRALSSGISMAVLRASSLPPAEYLELARRAVKQCEGTSAVLLANPPPGTALEEALATGVDGLHLTATRLRETRRNPVAAGQWLSASCHDEQELAAAAKLGCDFAWLSPVCTTLTHPDMTPLGWQRFSEMVETVNLPVYALGGMNRHDCTLAWAAGGQGVAAMRSLWPAEVVTARQVD